ncbi:MAG: 5-formyltetrahydrofolate cyclo-ligase [Bacteroidetes bacterium]|nr:5-formyltetrahydrofolate cyclo-ligase [Bacteroidota bacterium]
MNKSALRKLFLEKRQKLSRSEFWMLTDALMEQVKHFHWDGYKMVHIFMPIKNKNEVDTFSILSYFKLNFPNLKIAIPKTDFENLKIENVLYDPEHTILGRNKYDIPEPIYGRTVPAEQIELVFVPLLAFDKMGNRAGYGKGFYDRFLKTCRPDVKKIGLSLFDPVDRIDDINEFDIKMDACICPNKIWVFNNRKLQI